MSAKERDDAAEAFAETVARAIVDAIADIECGKVWQGVAELRAVVAALGHAAPPPLRIAALEPRDKDR